MKNGDAKPKSVLITGATEGLGKALALLLAERGYRVFAAGRSAEKLAELDHIAREKKLAMESIALDVRSEEHTSELQSPDHLVCRLLLEKKKTVPRQSPSRCYRFPTRPRRRSQRGPD